MVERWPARKGTRCRPPPMSGSPSVRPHQLARPPDAMSTILRGQGNPPARAFLCLIRLGLFQLLQHLLRDEVHPLLVEVVAVVGQKSAGLVVLVVFLPVAHERLAQVVERNLLLLG